MAKILIVDDQRNMRTTLAMMLRGASYEVDEAADGEQGQTEAQPARTRRLDRSADGDEKASTSSRDERFPSADRSDLDDGVRHDRERRRGDAPRRVELHPEALHGARLLVKMVKALDNRRLAGEVTFLATGLKDRYRAVPGSGSG